MDLPDKLESLGRSPEFDRANVPEALLARHALAPHNWARVHVLNGALTFVDLEHDRSTRIAKGQSGVVPPVLPHRVELDADAHFQLEFFRETD